MCTAVSLKVKDKYLFGRNMDIDVPFGQSIVITPRNYQWDYKYQKPAIMKYAIIGMAFDFKVGNKPYPMYAEATNEKGLSMAGLNFPGNAHYFEPNSIEGAFQLTPYEFIPYVLSNFSNANEVEAWIKNNNVILVNHPIVANIPLAPLHFIICDIGGDGLVIEQTKEGLKVFEDDLGVMTNNPTFDWHTQNLAFYQNLGVIQKQESNWSGIDIIPFGEGFASVGLPGDWTPPSRFVRTAFLKVCSTPEIMQDLEAGISQCFHILDNVAMVKGSIRIPQKDGSMHHDITLYSSCTDMNDGVYYYKTYFNNQINVIDMHAEDLDSVNPIVYPFSTKQNYNFVNKK